MKLTKKQFDDWCRDNVISPEAKLQIEKIRNSEPARRVSSGAYSVSGAFPSRKMGLTIQYESHKNELPFIHELEHDPDVLEFYDQPCRIKLEYISKNGRKTGVLHTPDFFVIGKDKAFFVECKTEDNLLELSIKNPNRFSLDETGDWICPPGIEYAKSIGLDYILRSGKAISWIFQRNIEFLDDYYRNDKLTVEKKEYSGILAVVDSNPAIMLEELFRLIESENLGTKDDIHTLIVTDRIYVDLYSHLLVEPQNVPIFADKDVADAYTNIISDGKHSDAAETAKPNLFKLVQNQGVVWDGKGWKIINIGENEITLIDQSDNISEIKKTNFERLVLSKKIQPLSQVENDESAVSEHLEILLKSDRQSLAEANKRLAYVQQYLDDKDAVKDFPVSEKTVRRWVKSYRLSELANGRGYYGLIPKPNNGNGNLKIDEESKTALENLIINDFENLTSKNGKNVYEKYKTECEKQGIIPASYVTFCKYVKDRPKDIQTRKRKGKRAAYKYEDFYWTLDYDTPRHGERPFHIAHIDHTELDIELVDSVTGKNLGRPWLTFLIDAFTRRILALYLTFNNPSRISCMMVLRECVKRHGRLPQIIIVDGGKDFSSIYFETLLAAYEVNKKTRPSAKARFGSVIERLFRTNDTQFIHNLQGNTKITKNVRQVTKSNNPKNLAVWNLGILYKRLCEWAYEVYDQTEHSSLGQSPREAFAQGMLKSGERNHKYIPYDENFKMMTLPGPPKGKAKIDFTRGVKINTIYYWSNEFRVPGVAGKSVPVKYDPFDMGMAYAFVNGKWRECHSDHYSVLKGRSEREVYLATKELKKRLNGSPVSTSKLAEFLNSIEQDELTLNQHIGDREQRIVIHEINGDLIPGNSISDMDILDSTAYESADPRATNIVQFPVPETFENDDMEDEVFTAYPVM